ncbi:MAG: hypothetical protein HY929_01135 [Euryarchaeota archaeon]|nr:hypothetical protein [Euryarchaeota archaeon]
MNNIRIIILFASILVIATIGTVSAKEYVIGDQKTPVVMPDPTAVYMGAEKCKTCHKEKYDDWKTSGHPYKLMTPDEAKTIRSDLPLPEGYTWNDILYVLGGWGWKARFIDKNGFIITKTGPNRDKNGSNQYNLETKKWSNYEPGAVKKYDCTKCHNTGSSYDSNHMGLLGIVGDWEFRGVQCEACHGPGSEHIAKGGGKGVAIVINKSSAFCGLCHVRGDPSKIPAKDGFIDHHEQYPELLAGPHKVLQCISCHNPHKGTHKGATNPTGAANGIKQECETCHSAQKAKFNGSTMQKAGVKCTDCHMPEATKSAVGDLKKFDGDVKTHIFRINTDVNVNLTYKTADGKEYATGYITVDFACLTCHPEKNKEWASKYAKGVHSFVKVAPTPPPAPKKGICGPTAMPLIAIIPVIIYAILRRKLK